MPVLDYSGATPREVALIERTLSRVRFNFDRLGPGLRQNHGRDRIPIGFRDLSAFARIHTYERNEGHEHVHDNEGNEAHLLADERRRPLGLYWLRPPRIEVEVRLLDTDPELAAEVLIAELAHAVDYCLLTDEQRMAIFAAYHPDMTQEQLLSHGHNWFPGEGPRDPQREDSNYWNWPGESFMGGFMLAFSDIPISLDKFTHESTPEIGNAIRDIIDGPVTEPAEQLVFLTSERSEVFHDRHDRLRQWTSIPRKKAVALGLRPCGTCKP